MSSLACWTSRMKVGGPGTVYDKVSHQAKIVQHTLAEVREREQQLDWMQVNKPQWRRMMIQLQVNKPQCRRMMICSTTLSCSDSYKITHYLPYPPDTQVIYSYFEYRRWCLPRCLRLWIAVLLEEVHVCFFGLQYSLKKYLVGEVVTMQKIDQAEAFFRSHFFDPLHGYNESLFNRAGWEYIVKRHGGKLPVTIKAVPEGTVVPYKNVIFTMENTEPQCFWLSNFLQTLWCRFGTPQLCVHRVGSKKRSSCDICARPAALMSLTTEVISSSSMILGSVVSPSVNPLPLVVVDI